MEAKKSKMHWPGSNHVIWVHNAHQTSQNRTWLPSDDDDECGFRWKTQGLTSSGDQEDRQAMIEEETEVGCRKESWF